MFGLEKKHEKKQIVCGAPVEGVCCVKVLGMGCKTCHQQYEYAKAAVERLGLDVTVEYVTDLEKVMAYGALSMPAIVINDKVAASGRLLKPAQVEELLRAAQ